MLGNPMFVCKTDRLKSREYFCLAIKWYLSDGRDILWVLFQNITYGKKYEVECKIIRAVNWLKYLII